MPTSIHFLQTPHTYDVPEEIWLSIPGSRYMASNYGRIRSPFGRTLRIRKPQKHRLGYRILQVTIHGVMKSRTVHSLIAMAFIGPRPEGLDIAHWDGDKTNNAVWNLRYATRKDNVADDRRNGVRRGGPRFTTPEAVRDEIVALRKGAMSSTELAAMFGVTRWTVDRYVRIAKTRETGRVYSDTRSHDPNRTVI